MKTGIVETALTSAPIARPLGRVRSIAPGRADIDVARHEIHVGDDVWGAAKGAQGEVMSVTDTHVRCAIDTGSLAVGDRIVIGGAGQISPDPSWLGRIVDPLGAPLDGRQLSCGASRSIVPDAKPATPGEFGAPLNTGFNALDTLLPLAEGQRLGLFAPAGVGKSTLLQQLASRIDVDVVVVGLVGERRREVAGFLARLPTEADRKKCVVVAAPGDSPALLRRRCAAAATTVAVYFSEAGLRTLLIIDSLTRTADAHREIASAFGEAPSLAGYPPSTIPLLSNLLERAGRRAHAMGSITSLYSVLVGTEDQDDPVATVVKGLLDGHVALSAEIASRGRWPAIDVLSSVSRALPDCASAHEAGLIAEARQILALLERNRLRIESGLYTAGTDARLDAAIAIASDFMTFLTSGSSGRTKAFDQLQAILELSALNTGAD